MHLSVILHLRSNHIAEEDGSPSDHVHSDDDLADMLAEGTDQMADGDGVDLGGGPEGESAGEEKDEEKSARGEASGGEEGEDATTEVL